MDYFIISQDKRVLNAPEPVGITNFIGREMLKKDKYRDMDDLPVQCDIKENSRIEYTDFIEYPIPIVSDALRKLLKKYDERLYVKPVILADMKKQNQTLYWFIAPEFIECLSAESEFNKDGSIKKLVINEKKINNRTIFKIDGIYENYIVVRLDLAESILRRDYSGICFKKIEKEI